MTRYVHRYHLKWIYQEMDIQVFYLKSNGQLINRCNVIPVKIPAHIFLQKLTQILKLHREMQGRQNSQKSHDKEEQGWRTHAL